MIMDSYHSRASSCLTMLLTGLSCMALFNFLTGAPLHPAKPSGSLEVADLLDLRYNRQFLADEATLAFKYAADLRSLFNWNTKNLFVYICAHYPTDKAQVNEVTVWDRIIEHREDALALPQEILVEYKLRDKYRQLRSTPVVFSLRYEKTPMVGPLQRHTIAQAEMTMPAEYKYYK